MYGKTIEIKVKEGLHARPAAEFVKAATKFRDTNIRLSVGGSAANAKSIMSVLSLGAGAGSMIYICADGIQEKEAVETLCALVE